MAVKTNSISSMGTSETIYNSFIPNTFNKLIYNNIDPSWRNTASVMMDPFLSNNGKVTVNQSFLHKGTFETKDNYSAPSINCPPNYLSAKIKILKGGDEYKTIPVIFPGSFSNSISASYAKESPVGSKLPIVAFEHTDAETFPFSFVALADYLPSGYGSLKSYLDDLKEMVKPNYSGSTVKSPSVVLYFADYAVTCVCTSISISYDEIYNNNSLVKATVSCEFTKFE